ncbi:hypothetical protein [Anaerotignum propionicum]|uniref:hypothetical protein n=1 Tax=Anaerotignum propionicum TaxID=28446 RepID=UPI00210B3E34|nr:hypothetical protein [Anaerotignum propionicum]MCQ4935441.1 hypothetical protein [Anaerotignum propionicum]
MEFFMKLPRNKKEFALFLGIVSVLSVNIIAPLISCFEMGFTVHTWGATLRIIPFLWLCVIILVLFTHKPAQWLTAKLVSKQDSFHPQIIINILCTVFLMSIFLTVIGTWIGTRQFSLVPTQTFFYKWPRNFTISFFVECCIAQPIAHQIMKKVHTLQGNNSSVVEE